MTAPIVSVFGGATTDYNPPVGPRDAAHSMFDARANRALMAAEGAQSARRFFRALQRPGTLWERVAEGRRR